MIGFIFTLFALYAIYKIIDYKLNKIHRIMEMQAEYSDLILDRLYQISKIVDIESKISDLHRQSDGYEDDDSDWWKK